ncbi:flagellar hook-length control protein FliK [Thioalkalivibrio sp. ALJ1]|uniref:flagellar hook-length control protein FliK n=1 Tax=Thioalkalivibrio sp. ALJ1 TaxID=1158144 RepID=UPI000570FBDD|nr:flagellar hook-length control protein FliK [Thioalkalivibrio sp. ALJ1]
MADLNGPRVPGWMVPGASPAGTAASERLNLTTGTRVEVRVIEVLADRAVRLRLEAPTTRAGPGTPSTPVVTAQLAAGALPDALLNRSAAAIRAQPMLAEITRTEPRLEARLIPLAADRTEPRPSRNVAANPAQQWLGQELRHQLPGARPLAQALQSLLPSALAAARPDAGEAPAQPAPPALQRILEQLPGPGQLVQPDTLRHQVQQSGLWMEAMLGQAVRSTVIAPQLAADLKVQLLRAADQLRQTPPQPRMATPTPSTTPTPAVTTTLPSLTGLLEGLLKRVTSLQLQSLQSFASDEPGNNRWFFELPFRGEQGIHGIMGEIREGSGAEQEGQDAWSIVLTLDLTELGPTRIAVASREGNMNVHFTASEPNTVARLREQMPELRERLARRELKITGLSVRQGPVDTDPRPASGGPRMLDEQA